MQRRFWRSEEFEALNREWGTRLKEAGFEDIETEAGELKQNAHYSYRRKEHVAAYRETKLAYFLIIAEHVLGEKNFEDESDRRIMERTSDGWSIQEISRELKKLGLRKHNRDTIRYVRRRYENRWGIRQWKPSEMISRRVPTK